MDVGDIQERFGLAIQEGDWRLRDAASTYRLLEKCEAVFSGNNDDEVGDLLIEACLAGDFIAAQLILQFGASLRYRNGEALQISVAVLSGVFPDHADFVLRLIGTVRLTLYLYSAVRASRLMEQIMKDPTLQSLQCVLELDKRDDRGYSQSYATALRYCALEDTQESVRRLEMLLRDVPFPPEIIAEAFIVGNQEYLTPSSDHIAHIQSQDVRSDEVLTILSSLAKKLAELDATLLIRLYRDIVEYDELTYYSAVALLSTGVISGDLEEEVLRVAKKPYYNSFIGQAIGDASLLGGTTLSGDAFARLVDGSYESNPELFSLTFPPPGEGRLSAWQAYAFMAGLQYKGDMKASERDELKRAVLTPVERSNKSFL